MGGDYLIYPKELLNKGQVKKRIENMLADLIGMILLICFWLKLNFKYSEYNHGCMRATKAGSMKIS